MRVLAEKLRESVAVKRELQDSLEKSKPKPAAEDDIFSSFYDEPAPESKNEV